MANKYELTADAYGDLEGIGEYTLGRWGSRQRERYLGKLFEAFGLVANNPESGKPRDEVHDGARSLPVGEHVVFYTRQHGRLVVLRILHHRQDPEQAFEQGE